MSAYVMSKEDIDILTAAAYAAIEAAKQYGGSYPLSPETLEAVGGLDMHNLYRYIYITNIKAVNGRYGDDVKTLPKYTGVKELGHIENVEAWQLKKAIGRFGCYMYQCAEDPIYGGREWHALNDIYKLLSLIYCKKTIGWGDE